MTLALIVLGLAALAAVGTCMATAVAMTDRVIAYLDRRGEQRAVAEFAERLEEVEKKSREALTKARDVHNDYALRGKRR